MSAKNINNKNVCIDGELKTKKLYKTCLRLLESNRPESIFFPPISPKFLKNISEKIIFIYNHGTSSGEARRICRPKLFIEAAKKARSIIKNKSVHYYYLCSSVLNHGRFSGEGHISIDREMEIIKLLKKFISAGVLPKHIFLVGQSMGTWASLRVAASHPKLINAVIGFSPGCCGTGVSPRGFDVVNEMRRYMLKAKNVNAYVISHKNDPYNAVWINERLFDNIPGLQLRIVPKNNKSLCNRVRNPHNLRRSHGCYSELLSDIYNFVDLRIDEYAKRRNVPIIGLKKEANIRAGPSSLDIEIKKLEKKIKYRKKAKIIREKIKKLEIDIDKLKDQLRGINNIYETEN